MRLRPILMIILTLSTLFTAQHLHAAGTLTPVGSTDSPIEIRDHHLAVTINNGFARTEVTQTFFNPNAVDLEAIYAFPLPKSASLSEVTIWIDERAIHGEVLPAEEAERIYEEEKSAGGDAGLAKKETYQRFEFAVHPVRANDETRLQFVYYQPLEIDTGVGRYVYPLADGGTDHIARSFWLSNEKVEGTFSAEVEIKSEFPIDDVRMPGLENEAIPIRHDAGHHTITLNREGATLDRDLVVYYRFAQDLPGRVELVAYRPDPNRPGTFMMVVTPGIDLQPIDRGADYTFVLDVSGSMEGKLGTLGEGVSRSLGELRPHDRFRIITFSDRARDLTGGYVDADPRAVASWIEKVRGLRTEGGTNLYDALDLALRNLDDDRATSVVLVTDAVTNEGIIDPREFAKLLETCDVRIFGFVMGNGANWPLMNVIADVSGGFATGVSNDDDILGQILLAKSKITHESLHDVSLHVGGVHVFDATDDRIGKVYRGQQLVVFGRYDKGGPADVTLKARMTGQDRTYRTSFDFPETDLDNPEIERLWALARIESIESRAMAGLLPPEEAESAIESLGVTYQLVTDFTSMLVLPDERFESLGIDRRNQARTAEERAAQSRRAGQPIRSNRVDGARPMFDHSAPHVSGGSGGGGGAGAIDPLSAALAALLGGAVLARRRRRRQS